MDKEIEELAEFLGESQHHPFKYAVPATKEKLRNQAKYLFNIGYRKPSGKVTEIKKIIRNKLDKLIFKWHPECECEIGEYPCPMHKWMQEEEKIIDEISNAIGQQPSVSTSQHKDHVVNSQQPSSALKWFTTSNPLLGNVSPIWMIKNGRENKLLKFIENCIDENGDFEQQPKESTIGSLLDHKFGWQGDDANDVANVVKQQPSDEVKSCGCCGSKMVYIRGKYPKEDNRLICPCCAYERLEQINEISSKNYGVANTGVDNNIEGIGK